MNTDIIFDLVFFIIVINGIFKLFVFLIVIEYRLEVVYVVVIDGVSCFFYEGGWDSVYFSYYFVVVFSFVNVIFFFCRYVIMYL